MTDDNTYRTKGRAVFLAAIMVLSMVAVPIGFAGAATAQAGNDASVDINRQVLDTSTGNTVTVASASGVTDPYTVAIWNVTASGEPDEIITFVEVSSGDQTNLEIPNVDINETQTLAAAVHNGTGNDTNTDPEVVDTATVRVADQEQTTDGQLIWQGQAVRYNISTASSPSADNLQLRQGEPDDVNDSDGNSLVTELSVDDNGQVYIQTGDLEAGRYFISNDGGTSALTDSRFEVAPQSVDADWDSERVSNEGERTEADLTVESNRDDYDVEVSAEGLDADDLDEIFPNADTVDQDNDVVVFEGVSTNETIEANFTDADGDDYNFTVSAADTTAEDDAPIEVRTIEGDVTFNQDIYETAAGDVTNVTLELEDTDEVVLFVGGSEVNYIERVRLTDENENGSVTVNINSRNAGLNDSDESSLGNAYEAGDGTEVEVLGLEDSEDYDDLEINETLNDPIEPASYEIAAGTTASYTISNNNLVVDDEVAISSLELVEPELSGVRIHTAPTADADDQDLNELLGQVSKGDQDPTEVALEDRVVVQIEITGVYGTFDDPQSLADSPATISVEENSSSPNRDPIQFNVSDVEDSEKVQLIPSQEAGSVFVVIDLRDVEAADGDQNRGEVRAEQEYNASITFNDSAAYYTDETANSSEFELIERSGEFDNEPYNVTSAENQTVSGTTTIAPNTEIGVRVRSSGNTSPNFVKTTNVDVQEDGTFNASFDFSDQSVGDTYTVSVRSGNFADQVQVDGEVVENVGTETPTEMDTDTPTEDTDTPTEDTDTPTEMDTDTPTEMDTDTPTETEDGTPGFGAVVALVALLAAALLAVRRD